MRERKTERHIHRDTDREAHTERHRQRGTDREAGDDMRDGLRERVLGD